MFIFSAQFFLFRPGGPEQFADVGQLCSDGAELFQFCAHTVGQNAGFGQFLFKVDIFVVEAFEKSIFAAEFSNDLCIFFLIGGNIGGIGLELLFELPKTSAEKCCADCV